MATSAALQNPDRIERVRRTAALRKEMSDRCIDYEDDMIKELIQLYYADQLTETKLRGVIGGIAALRRLVDDMEADLAREG